MTNNDKKYLVPVEMDREYAAKIGINPNEIKRIRLYGKMTEVHFVEVDDEKTYYGDLSADEECDGIVNYMILLKKLLAKIIVHEDYLEFTFKSGVTVSVEK